MAKICDKCAGTGTIPEKSVYCFEGHHDKCDGCDCHCHGKSEKIKRINELQVGMPKKCLDGLEKLCKDMESGVVIPDPIAESIVTALIEGDDQKLREACIKWSERIGEK